MKTCTFATMAEELGISQEIVNALEKKYAGDYGKLFVKAFGYINDQVRRNSEADRCFAEAALEHKYIYKCSQTELGFRALQKDIFGVDIFDIAYYYHTERQFTYFSNGERSEISEEENQLIREKAFDIEKFERVSPYGKSQIAAITEELLKCSKDFYATANAYYEIGLKVENYGYCPPTRRKQEEKLKSAKWWVCHQAKLESLLLSSAELDLCQREAEYELEWLKKDPAVCRYLELTKIADARMAAQDTYTPVKRDVLAMLPIDECDFSVYLHNVLKNAGFNKVGDFIDKTEGELRQLRGMGDGCIEELQWYFSMALGEKWLWAKPPRRRRRHLSTTLKDEWFWLKD